MAVIGGDQAIQRLAAALKSRDDPDDPGPLGELGESWDRVLIAMRSLVEKTGNACKGKITFTIDLKAYRTKGNEVGLEVETGVVTKAPAQPKRGTMLYLDHEANAHTAPVQEDLPIFHGPKGAIEGGKANGNGKAAEAAKKATV